jgi:phospholipid/cholesterol/gamma-HCH transport system ATP-binding protein
MRRRVGFARAIVLEPETLLFDEPTAALDPVMVSVINGVIGDLVRRLRATMVMVTHDLSTARAVGDRIALLFGGKICADAPADKFFSLEQPEVRQFVEGQVEGPLTREQLA